MPKYFCIVGLYGDMNNRRQMVKNLRKKPVIDLMGSVHGWYQEVDAVNPKNAIDVLEENFCREGIFYIAVYSIENVDASKMKKPLVRWRKCLAEWKAWEKETLKLYNSKN